MKLPPKERLVKYLVASMCGVVLGQSCLLFFYVVLDMPGVQANIAAVAISSGPAYIINRYWVWAKKDANSLSREIVPFWTMSFLGLLLSSIIVYYAEQRSDASYVIAGANLAGFGVLWVAKFFVLDRLMFGGGASMEEHLEPPPIL